MTTSFFWLALLALVLSYGAYVAEVFRAGIESVHPSQVASATALGLRGAQALRHVVVPQGVRRVLPPLLNDFVSLQKDTALVAAVGMLDALGTASDTANYTFNFTPYVVAGALFVALTVPLARFTDWVGGGRWSARGPGPGELPGGDRGSARPTATRWSSTVSTSPSSAVRWSASSARRAPASRRCCGAWTCSSRPTTGRSCSTGSS